jgi:hypothetical protein
MALILPPIYALNIILSLLKITDIPFNRMPMINAETTDVMANSWNERSKVNNSLIANTLPKTGTANLYRSTSPVVKTVAKAEIITSIYTGEI